MNAYDKTYLEDAMSNLAVMLDYGSMTYGDPELFFDRFLVSDISKQFGSGSPRYIAGMSGIELAEKVIEDTGGMPIYAEYKGKSVNPLKRQRKSAGLTQKELADRSGVKVRMIKAYEQGYQDISKAEALSVIKLARALKCLPEDLLS